MSERTPLRIWVYLTKNELKLIRKGIAITRKVGKLADALPIEIVMVKEIE